MTSSWGKQSKYGAYEIVGADRHTPRLLGEGGFGKTYEAVRRERVGDSEIEEHVAIKVLNPDLLTSDAKRQQFLAELFALTKFQHPNLIQYISCGEEKGEVYFAMELCRGGDLLGMVRRLGPLPERAAAQIVLQVAAGLKEVHQKHQLVHRDIKPSNIMLSEALAPDLARDHMELRFEQETSLCRLVDFGLVDFALKVEKTPGRFVGTPMYASPEQIRGERADHRSDIYSLGMTLWFLVQGKGPLLDDDAHEIRSMDAAMLRHASPEDHELPLHVSKGFREVLARMVAKPLDRRIGSASELQSALREYLATPEDPNEVKFVLTRIARPLDEAFELGPKLSAHAGRSIYSARQKPGGRSVKLCLAGRASSGSEMEALRLGKLAELSYEPSLPHALALVQKVIWAEDFLAYTEDLPPHVVLAELLGLRHAGRSLSFAEAVFLFQPIAQALDFLLAHGRDAVSLSSEEVILLGPTAAARALDPDALLLPLSEWNGLQPCFSLMPPPVPEETPDGQTIAGSMQLEPDDARPLPAFARLVYRVLVGSEVSLTVRFAPQSFVPTVNLRPASNQMLCEVLAHQHEWPTVSEFLRDLAASEGVPVRPPTPAAIARIVSPGRVRTPFAPGGSGQTLPREAWIPGREFLCAITRKRVALPSELPPWAESPSIHEAPTVDASADTPTVVDSEMEMAASLQKTMIAAPGKDSPADTGHSPEALPEVEVPAEAPTRSSWLGKALVGAVLLAALAGAAFYWIQSRHTHRSTNLSPADAGFDGTAAGETRVIGGLPFHWCPPTGPQGFVMGSPDTEVGRRPNETKHAVLLTHGFWMAETEVTQSQWQAVEQTTLRQQAEKAFADKRVYGAIGKKQTIREISGFQNVDQMLGLEDPRAPIYWVDWSEASDFCDRLTKQERAGGKLPPGWAFTLPNEAQWEYACRAGTVTSTYAGKFDPPGGATPPIFTAPVLDRIAWYGGNSGAGYQGRGFEPMRWVHRDLGYLVAGPRLVGQKTANAWGLTDMLGNVCNWCRDYFGSYSGDAERDPEGPANGVLRVRRGSYWNSSAGDCRAAVRFRENPHIRTRYLGFRPVVVVVQPGSVKNNRPAAPAPNPEEAPPGEENGA